MSITSLWAQPRTTTMLTHNRAPQRLAHQRFFPGSKQGNRSTKNTCFTSTVVAQAIINELARTLPPSKGRLMLPSQLRRISVEQRKTILRRHHHHHHHHH